MENWSQQPNDPTALPAPDDAGVSPFAAPYEDAPDGTAPPPPQEVDELATMRQELESLRTESATERDKRLQLETGVQEFFRRQEAERAQATENQQRLNFEANERRYQADRTRAIEQGVDPVVIARAEDERAAAIRAHYEGQLTQVQQRQQIEQFPQMVAGIGQHLRNAVGNVANFHAQQHGLSPQQTERLMFVHPDQMGSFAQDMARGNQTGQQLQQNQTNQQYADRQARGADRVGGVGSGGGRGSADPGSDAQLLGIFRNAGVEF